MNDGESRCCSDYEKYSDMLVSLHADQVQQHHVRSQNQAAMSEGKVFAF